MNATKSLSKCRFDDLTAEEIAKLTKTGHGTAVQVAEGKWVEAEGYSGVVRGTQSSWWLTGPTAKVDGKFVHQPDGRAY